MDQVRPVDDVSSNIDTMSIETYTIEGTSPPFIDLLVNKDTLSNKSMRYQMVNAF